MQNKVKNPILNEQQRQEQRKRQIRSWIILLSVIAAVALVMVIVNALRSDGHSITATSLPCYAHQNVTTFQDGVLYYDGASIHFVNAGGGIEWSYPVGGGASFSASDTNIIAWAGTQLAILDAQGRSTFNRSMEETILFARIGKKHAAIVTGDELTSTVYVKDLQGAQIDFENTQFEGQVMLDCGFYGASDEYMWTLSYDFYAPIVTTLLHTFQVGQMNTGIATLTNYLPSKVLYLDSKLHVFTTQQLYTYDYKGVEDTSGKTLIYGWCYLDHYTSSRTATSILLAPDDAEGIRELRILSGGKDRRYNLPTDCVGAAVTGNRIYAISAQYMYSGTVESQKFYTHTIPLPDGRAVTDFIGLTDNGYAIVVSNSEVFSVSLPK